MSNQHFDPFKFKQENKNNSCIKYYCDSPRLPILHNIGQVWYLVTQDTCMMAFLNIFCWRSQHYYCAFNGLVTLTIPHGKILHNKKPEPIRLHPPSLQKPTAVHCKSYIWTDPTVNYIQAMFQSLHLGLSDAKNIIKLNITAKLLHVAKIAWSSTDRFATCSYHTIRPLPHLSHIIIPHKGVSLSTVPSNCNPYTKTNTNQISMF